jgi:hypothetical protein
MPLYTVYFISVNCSTYFGWLFHPSSGTHTRITVITASSTGQTISATFRFRGASGVAEKILKYKNLTIEIQRMWNVKTKVIPVIIGATGTISKSFRKYVRNIPGSHEVKEIQKTAILGTAHILRKVLT